MRTRTLASMMLLAVATASAAPRAVAVGPGTYRPVFPTSPGEAEVVVARFRLDVTPVSNGDFLAFVKANPAWQRGRVKAVRADADYLGHWAGPLTLGAAAPAQAPVVRVSWFAAKAYCAWRGGRLPTEREWELAAQASATARDGTAEPAWQERILAWYAAPTPTVLPAVGQGEANAWGVHDLHGLVWEWVYDFGAALVASDDRERGDADRDKYCGAGAALARDPRQYATFMRLAFRSSLQARYTTANLGFRCAADLPRPGKGP
ncbi:MAG: formylglycine-generating enzyme family protein [Myxococcales bacterium]|nr:formylglycine-generating enzyme family protein [Myxococcales bacterium]MBK7194010.1 formylglycine-generating enzyme family protein [Myxococcales bacterium]MBP6847702.1 formylglycine-generating enzyme family protein [Kofleriaceae bacterium]